MFVLRVIRGLSCFADHDVLLGIWANPKACAQGLAGELFYWGLCDRSAAFVTAIGAALGHANGAPAAISGRYGDKLRIQHLFSVVGGAFSTCKILFWCCLRLISQGKEGRCGVV